MFWDYIILFVTYSPFSVVDSRLSLFSVSILYLLSKSARNTLFLTHSPLLVGIYWKLHNQEEDLFNMMWDLQNFVIFSQFQPIKECLQKSVSKSVILAFLFFNGIYGYRNVYFQTLYLKCFWDWIERFEHLHNQDYESWAWKTFVAVTCTFNICLWESASFIDFKMTTSESAFLLNLNENLLTNGPDGCGSC